MLCAMTIFRTRTLKFLPLLIIFIGMGVAAVASAQVIERKLHEYFQTPASYDELRASGPETGSTQNSSSSTQPPRLPSREPGEPPPLTLSASEDEPLVGEDGPQSSRPMDNPQGGLDPLSAQNQLDDNTDRVDELDYYSSFDPSVIPFKRLVSQNLVRYQSGQYVFAVDPQRFTTLPIDGGEPRSDEDVFWGTFLVKASPGVSLPIASVAPNQRIIQALSEPPSAVTVTRDAAGNHSLVVDGEGLTRVNLKIAVPRSYFIGDFEPIAWSQIDRSKVLELPGEAKQQARRVLDELGISRSMDPHRALIELIAYFRGFEGRAFPQELRGDDLYYSIATNKIGVCRHRSFAFVITASALGIPTRYVYNEAHAFVEVLWPGVGWRRVDLGGAAQDVLLRSQNQGRVHDVGAPDQLPQPEAYVEELNRMAQQEEQRREHAGQGDNGGMDFPDGPMNSIDDDSGNDGSQGNDSQANQGADSVAQGSDDDPFFDSADFERDERTPVRITLDEPPAQLERGSSFTFSGRMMTMAEQPLAQKTVRVMLSPFQASSPGQGRLLGEITTDMNGYFSAEINVPLDLSIGRWSLHAVFAGDEEYRSKTSD